MANVLLRPLLYLSIRHDSRTLAAFNWVLPIALAAGLVCAGAWLAPSTNLFHTGGLIEKLLSFVQSLPGFYLAALAAVATFARADLDLLMPGKPPTAVILYNGQRCEVELTRRRFLCLMFAYLTALSIIVTLGGVVMTVFVDTIRSAVDVSAVPWLRALGAFTFLAATMQMLVITLWGLYYLGERMHTPDA